MVMERLSDTAIEIINELHTERLDYSSEYIPLIDAANRLAAYEDTGLEPEEIERIVDAGLEPKDIISAVDMAKIACALHELNAYKDLGPIDHIRDLIKAEQDGRLVELPFVAMVEQSLQDGKMKPMGDQKHNGRYAVVYVDHNKWKSPLIDICGKPYDREEAEARMAVLTQKDGESDA